jgi:hypothetical protein
MTNDERMTKPEVRKALASGKHSTTHAFGRLAEAFRDLDFGLLSSFVICHS